MRTVDVFSDCAKFNLEDRHTVIILLVVSCPAKMNVLSLDINVSIEVHSWPWIARLL
jgi:hypothetical protein